MEIIRGKEPEVIRIGCSFYHSNGMIELSKYEWIVDQQRHYDFPTFS